MKLPKDIIIKAKAIYNRGGHAIKHCLYALVCIIFSTFTILGSVAQAETIITNSATVNFSISGTPQALSDSVQFTKDTVVAPSDTIEFSKQVAPTSAYAGDIVTYTLSITNPNNTSLNNVSIQDTLSSSLQYITGSAMLNSSAIDESKINYAGNLLSISLNSMPANTTWSIQYFARANATGSLVNRAFVVSDTVTSTTDNAIVTVTNRPITEPSVSAIVLAKEADKTLVKLGDIIHYTFSIKNPNNSAISTAKIIDTLPTELSYISGSATLNNIPVVADLENGLRFTLGTIPANATWSFAYDAKVNSTKKKQLINQATVISSNANSNSNIAKATVEVSDDIITISKSVNKTKTVAGDILDYTIFVQNPADHDLNNLVINDTLPKGFIFQTGSAKFNGHSVIPKNIQQVGQTLTFKIGHLAKDQTINLGYKVKVSDGTKPGKATNTAQANSDLAVSKVVQAITNVRTPSTIKFLKINENGTEFTIPPTSYNDDRSGGKHWEELSSIVLADGSIVSLPTPQLLIKAGQYTLADPVVIEVTDLDQNIDPSAIDTIFITIEDSETGDKEVLLLQETSPNSGIFRGVVLTTTDQAEIQNGILSIQDNSKISVHYSDKEDSTDSNIVAALVIPNSLVILEKQADKETASIGELIRFTISANNRTDNTINLLELKDTLPFGFKLVSGSVTLNGKTLKTGVETNGQIISFKLGKMPIGVNWTIDYLTKISSGVQIGKVVNTVVLNNERFKSNTAKAIVSIKDDLMRSKNILTGRVYIGCNKDENSKVLKNARIYNETGRSVLTDKHGFWHMEDIQPGTHVLQIDNDSLPESYEAVLCRDNTRHAGNPSSQFVNLQAGVLWQVDFHVKQTNAHSVTLSNTKKQKEKTFNPIEYFGKTYVESAPKGFETLWPKNNYVPAISSTDIVIKSSPNFKTEVFLNGKEISPLNYEGSTTNKDRTVTVRRWKGVDINTKNRNNSLLVILKNKSGKEIARKTHNIHFSGEPASAEFIEKDSVLVADGKTIPVIVLRIKDEDGFPMRANTHGYYSIENGRFQIKTNNSEEDGEDLNESRGGNYQYQIEEGGIARIEFNPTTQSGELKLNLQFNNSTNKVIRAWLKPKLRDWIIVGLAEGTVAHNTLSGNMVALSSLDKTDNISKNGRIAFFAKGKVKGKVLLTIAYDTHKEKQKAGEQLEGNINPDAWYTLYADNSNSQYNAITSKKLYLKVEKENLYALFGDYRTGMNATQLAKYERTLNGIKSEYRGDQVSYKAFISETSNKHHHDEIPGDGSSGLYHLSHNILTNSETVKIETRDRFHSERIIESRQLTRYQDYDIDYYTGALFFKFPVTGRDKDFNPNIIVVDYDSETDSNKEIVAGGRVSAKTKSEKFEVGITLINIGRNNQDDDSLIAIDADYKINKNTKVHAEIAESKTEKSLQKSVAAQVLELEQQIKDMEAKVYYRKTEENFGIDSQNSESGTQKIGAEITYKVNNKTKLNAEVSKEKNLTNKNIRQLAEISVKHQYKQIEVTAGLRHSKEDLAGEKLSNNTVLLGGKYTTDNDRVTFRTDIEKNIGSSNNSEISPDRATIGVDVKLDKGITLFAEHETTKNKKTTTHNTRVGLSKELWKGAKGKTSYTQERTDGAQRNYATLGLSQKIELTDKISADFSIDRAETVGSKQEKFNNNEPNRHGSQTDDYTAFSVGLGSNDKDWSWTSRIELRKGEREDKVNFIASVIRRLDDGKQLSGKLSYYDSDKENGDSERISKLSFGSAWHPKGKDFVFLNRLDLVDEKSDLSATGAKQANTRTQKIIHNMHYNRKVNSKTQVSLHHGIKRIIDQNQSTKSSATIDTGTIEVRHDLNKKWDIGIKGGYLRDWTEKTTKTVAGVSVGVTPAKNAWVELGYNFEGFNDSDFDENDYKQKGSYISFRYKFDQNTLSGDLPIRR